MIYLLPSTTKPTLFCFSQNPSRGTPAALREGLWTAPKLSLERIWQVVREKTHAVDELQALWASPSSKPQDKEKARRGTHSRVLRQADPSSVSQHQRSLCAVASLLWSQAKPQKSRTPPVVLGILPKGKLFSRSVMSDSLWPQGLQHARLPCPSPSCGACSNSCPFESMMPSNHLILCHPLLSLPSIFPSIQVFFQKIRIIPNFSLSLFDV